MLKKLTFISTLIAVTSFAVVAQANTKITQQNFNHYCPSNNGLIFTPSNKTANSGGYIKGINGDKHFISPHAYQQPALLINGGQIEEVLIGGAHAAGFGQVADNGVTTCLYHYSGLVTHDTVYLALRSQL